MLVLGLICVLSFAAAAPAPQEVVNPELFVGNAPASEGSAEALSAAEPYYSNIPKSPQLEPQKPANEDYGSAFQTAPTPESISPLPEQESVDPIVSEPQPEPANEEYGSDSQPIPIPYPIFPALDLELIDPIFSQPGDEEHGSDFQSTPILPPIRPPPELEPINPPYIDNSILPNRPEMPEGNVEEEKDRPSEENKEDEQKPQEQQKPPVQVLDVNRPSFLANLFSNFPLPLTWSWPSLNMPNFSFPNFFGSRAIVHPASYPYPNYRYVVDIRVAAQPDIESFLQMKIVQ